MPNRRETNKDASQQKNSSEMRQLVLHNDEVNTFDYVIDSLREVCGHNRLQAEQCAIITHLKGSCDIKRGAYSELENMYNTLLHKFLTVTIE
jgi:ATP-dependent Clp protease adaptor protein ClpS